MGTLKVSDILTRAGRLLADEGATRWTNAVMVDWYNEGLLDMVTRQGSILVSVDTFTMVAGSQQAVASDRIAILDIGQNLGPVAKPRNGEVPPVYDKETMDAAYPGWQSSSPGSLIKAVVRNPVSPKIFYVFPPQPTTNPGRLSIIFSKRPSVVSVNSISSTTFQPDDEYEPIMIEYLLHRGCLADSDNPAMAGRASSHLQAYLGMLGAGAPQPQPQG